MEQQKDSYQKGPMNSNRTSQGQYGANTGDRVGSPHVSQGNMKQPVANFTTSAVMTKTGTDRHVVRQGFDYVVRKAEKLTTALYLVTDIMSEKEPLKWKAREIGVDLLSDITIASGLSASEKMSMLRDIMKKIEKTVAFLDVAQSARLMSEMNTSMLKKEYLALKDNIEGEWSRVYEKSKSIFSETFFDVPQDPVESEASVPTKECTHFVKKEVALQTVNEDFRHLPEMGRAPLAGTQVRQTQTETTGTSPAAFLASSQPMSLKKPDEVKMNPQGQGSQVPSLGAPSSPVYRPEAPRPQVFEQGMFVHPRNENDRDDRRKIILALIKQKPALTVRDITKSIPQVSEKTIQRELLSMVAENVLVKRGERRWSTYSLRVQ